MNKRISIHFISGMTKPHPDSKHHLEATKTFKNVGCHQPQRRSLRKSPICPPTYVKELLGAALKETENDKFTGHGHHQCGRRKIKATVH
jgi:hypothetical protein